MHLNSFFVAVLALRVAGCGGHRTEDLLGSAVVSTSVSQIAGNHAIFIATTRKRSSDPGKVFDLELPIADVAEGYKAMDERRAIKTLLRV